MVFSVLHRTAARVPVPEASGELEPVTVILTGKEAVRLSYCTAILIDAQERGGSSLRGSGHGRA